ncbi:MAG TPA: hypothetical protein VLS48_08960 [Anaerolineales bacterium]|nr:hypothetical protein [Anaerolineales bacterium]
MTGAPATFDLTPEQRQALVEMAAQANEELELAIQKRTTQAFNTGCAVPFVPVLFIALIVGWLSRSFVGFAIWILIGVLVMLTFALFVAYRAKIRGTETTYQLHIQPQLTLKLRQMQVDFAAFTVVAEQSLPEDALLRSCLQPSDAPSAYSQEQV